MAWKLFLSRKVDDLLHFVGWCGTAVLIIRFARREKTGRRFGRGRCAQGGPCLTHGEARISGASSDSERYLQANSCVNVSRGVIKKEIRLQLIVLHPPRSLIKCYIPGHSQG